MPRVKKDTPIDLARAHEISQGLIDRLTCPAGKQQVFLRAASVEGLRVRCTANGAKAWVYEAKVQSRTFRRTLGPVGVMSIPQAEDEARALALVVKTQKADPRERERQKAQAEAEAQAEARARADRQAAEQAAASVTAAQAWARYMAEGKPAGKDAWKPRYVADLKAAAAPGGEARKRGKGHTLPGHLWPLMGERLADIDADLIRNWYAKEAKRSPRQAARCAAMFSGFLRWCSRQREFRELVDAHAASADALRDLLPGKKRRTDALELGQLAAWFAGVAKLSSPVARAYLSALVLTGARREEMAGLRWDAVDFRWRKLTIADKVGDTRTIPLTPYVQALLEGLPKATLPDGKPNPYVFASFGKSGRIAEPRAPHQQVLEDAGIPHVSIHGLRRTFALMGEQAGAPAGAIAQVMGHRPSAVHEGYKPRSIDALRPYLERVEGFVLQAAGVEFTQPEQRGAGLRLVVGAS